jgi:dephospho-CoA kinase
MLRIGITGGIGSGKSTVCRILKNLGVPVFTSDEESKKILNNDPTVKKKIRNKFGKDMYTSAGEIDRPRMATLVFNDSKAMETLTGILHPKVEERFEEWCQQFEHRPYVVKEAAILFESGSYHTLDKVVSVFAPKEQRIKRVMLRDSISEEEVKRRMRFQYSDEERNQLADFIILNEDGADLLPQVMEMHEIFLNEQKKW